MTQLTGYQPSQRQAFLWKHGAPDLAYAACSIRVEKTLGANRLKAILTQLVARHEALRTRLVCEPGMALPLQIVEEEAAFNWETQPATELSQALASVLQKPAGELPLEAVLFGQDSDQARLVLRLPALCADAVSMKVLFGDMLALVQGSALLEEPVQFLDYSEWQHELLGQSGSVAAHRFFKQRYESSPYRLTFALTSDQPFKPQSLELPLETSIGQAGLLARFAALLHLLEGAPSVAIACHFDGRIDPSFHSGVGPFAQPAPLAFSFEENQTLAQLTHKASGLLAETRPFMPYHQGHAIDHCQGLAFDWQETADQVEKDSIRLEWSGAQEEPFLLKLTGIQGPQGLRLRLQFDGNRLNEGSIKQLALCLRQLCQAPTHKALTELVLLESMAPYQALNHTARDLPASCIHQLIRQGAQKDGQAMALISERGNWTRQQLFQAVDQISTRLISAGVGPEKVVAVSLPPEPLLVASVLAIWQVGAIYLPIDTSLPDDRKSFMLTDSAAGWLLTGQDQQFPNLTQVTRLHPESMVQAGQGPAFEVIADPDFAAYVIYTSGSTGTPKGVVITHRSLLNYLIWCREAYQTDLGRTAPLFSSIGFDFTITAMFLPLLAGLSLTLLNEEEGVEGLASFLEKHQDISPLKVTPAHLHLLNQWQTGEKAATSVQQMVCGGEALHASDVASWFGGPRIHNEYGPTEATVGCCVYSLQGWESGAIAIGSPIANTSLYVCDPQLNPLPPHFRGQLLIGGVGLARAYLGRPAQTAQKFIPNPFATTPGERLYQSGDLVQLDADNCLHYLGRTDHQVKVRGYRIEPGEIEAVLCRHPQISGAVVSLDSGNRAERRLVAHLTVSGQPRPDAQSLRDYLGQHLPDHMIPALMMILDQFPLTHNGKIDRTRLPQPGSERPDLGGDRIQPRTPLEQQVAGWWARALGVTQPGVEDNFFALGGDSIRALRVTALAREDGYNFTIQQLFRQPSIAQLAALLAAQTPEEKQAQVELLPETSPFSLISAADRAKMPDDVVDAYPLGAVQLGMLYHMNHNPSDPSPPAYHNLSSFKVRIPFHPIAMQKSIDIAIASHPVYRTAFDLIHYSEPMQLVYKEAKIEVDVYDLRGLPEKIRDQEVIAFIKKENQRRVDTSKAPMLRFFVHQVEDDVIWFSLTEPHSIADGWSTHLTLIDIFAKQVRLVLGQPIPTPEPIQVSYRDFIALERRDINSEQTRNFWKGIVANCTPTSLPRLPARFWPKQVGHRDHKLYLHIPNKTVDGLYALSRKLGVPFKSLLLLSHLKVLSILTGQNRVTSGLAFNGRPEMPGADRLRGLFLNTMPFPFRFDHLTWSELARAVFEQEAEMVPHRRYPLMMLKHSHSGRSLFDAAFSYHHFHSVADFRKENMVYDLDGVDLSTTNFDLMTMFHVTPDSDQSLLMILEADPLKVTNEQLRSWFSLYEQILGDMARTPDLPNNHRDYLAEESRALVVDAWQGRQRFPQETCPFQQFEQHARTTPQAIALVSGQQRLSYEQVNHRANQLARQLLAAGLELETPVGLYLERSPEVVIAILAILKAGGAYVPIDPIYPIERVNLILEDAAVKRVITQTSLADRLETTARLLLIDQPAAEPQEPRPLPAVSPENLAYIIYTSGSTGKPKGTLMTHNNIGRIFDATHQQYGFGADDVWLLFHSFAFDVSVWEIWGALKYGGTLVIPDQETTRDPDALLDLIASEQVSVLCQTPSAFPRLIEAEERSDRSLNLRYVIFAGERLEVGRLESWMKRHDPRKVKLINMYGITETTIHNSFRQLALTDLEHADESLVGGPLADLCMYLLDPHLHPAPVLTPGEICVSGPGLGRGYLNRPALTASRFVPNPLACMPGDRIYRSGDAARWLPDGDIQYIGRIDKQIKIRGFRVELGEIEAVIRSHEALEKAAVLKLEDLGEDVRLAAYVAPFRGVEAPTPAQLRSFLETRLPAYMIPSDFVVLESFPLTANGKLDVAALPAPDRETSAARGEYIAPRDPQEEELAVIFGNVLGLEKVGVSDDFFRIGGDSLLAVRLIGRLLNSGYHVPMGALMEHPTIAGLARVLNREQAEEAGSGETPLNPGLQWYVNNFDPYTHLWVASLLLPLPQGVTAEHSRRLLELLLERHDALRMRLFEENKSWHLRFLDGATAVNALAFHHFDLSDLEPDLLQPRFQEIAEKYARQINIVTGPAIIFVHLDLASESRLFLFISHNTYDAFGLNMLYEDMADLTGRLLRQQPIQPLNYSSTFAGYLTRVAEYARSEKIQTEKDYWLAAERLKPYPIPVDLDNGRHTVANMVVMPTRSKSQIGARLASLSRQHHDVSLNELLMYGLTAAYTQWAKDPHMRLDIENNGRAADYGGNLNTSKMMGSITVKYPLMLVLDPELDPVQGLLAVQKAMRQVPGYGEGYGLLRYCSPDPAIRQQLQAVPDAQIFFNNLGVLNMDASQQDQQAAIQSFDLATDGRDEPVTYDLILTVSVENGVLKQIWVFSSAIHQNATIERLSESFVANLEKLATALENKR